MNPDDSKKALLPSSGVTSHKEPSLEGSDSLVHTQESTDQEYIKCSYRQFLLSGLGDKPRVVENLFTDIDKRDGTNRLRAWRGCRTSAWFVQHRISGEIRVASKRCHLRWCPMCSRTDRFATTMAVKEKLISVQSPRFITLTLKHSSNNLADQIDHLYDAFRRLKRQKSFKEHVHGGVWFFQIKWIEESEEWHPHLHILWEGKYYPHDQLSRDWNKASSGSWIVDIRMVKDVEKSAKYVARYATEPCNLTQIPEKKVVSVYDSLYGRKIKGSFGLWKDVKLTSSPPDDADCWEYVGSYYHIMKQRHQWALCAEIVEAWLMHKSCQPMWIIPPEPPPNPLPIPDEIVTYRQLMLFRVD